MKITTDNNYGADADGNRGMKVTEYELEHTKEEIEEIATILFELGTTSEDTGNAEIAYDGIDIDVDISDYKEEIKGMEDAEGL